MTLTVRSATVSGATTKGSALTHAELDENFNHLSQSSNHTFTPSGTATSEDLQGKVRRDVGTSPQDYMTAADRTSVAGAGGGSTTDWTEALTALDTDSINGTYKKNLHVPAGIYTLATGIAPETFQDLVGEGRWVSRLMFALTAAGTCVDLAGADINDQIRSSLQSLRVDGTNCTDSAVVGVTLNANQHEEPLRAVTVYGGYESGGASTGLKYGIQFTEDGSEYQVSLLDVHVEGCHTDGVILDTAGGGANNIINFERLMSENNKGRNLVLIGPDDDTNSMQLNFRGCTFQGASYGTTGVASSVHVAGVKANFTDCWFEASASPNWATHEIRVESGYANFHNCHIAWCQRGFHVAGTVTLTGQNTIRSNTTAIAIAAGGTLHIHGEAVKFLGAGTPITYNDATSTISWVRDKTEDKTDDYTMTTADIGKRFTNFGAKKNITITMANVPSGATVDIAVGATDVRNSSYSWTLSGSGTNEYYLRTSAGANPGFSDPSKFYQGASRTRGTIGALANLEFAYGDNDALGYSTIYYRLDSGDPDALTNGNLFCTYTITLSPVNGQRFTPLGTTTTDTIVSDGTPGSALHMTMRGATGTVGFWIMDNMNGTWT
jgi:uncharacterized protein YbaA (DUF1428 family)